MSVSLKQKAIGGLFWSFVDGFFNQGFQFIVGIILARLLSPREFGLIGMLAIFIAISHSFVDSGFSNALIRKLHCTQHDYSTVFFFNIVIALVCYSFLFAGSALIASFYREPQLRFLIRVLGLSLIANSLAVIQRAILTKEINFKLQARVSIIASVGSGALAIAMAMTGFGVWSLVALTLSRAFLNSIFLWIWSKWRPILVFSRESFKELFFFGSKLLASGLIDTVFKNIYYLFIGKHFSAAELGYYTRADQFKIFTSQNLSGIIGRVSYPVLSSMQEDVVRLKMAYQRVIKSTMLLTFLLMLGLAAMAEPLIRVVIGDKWLPAVGYMQLLCLVGMFYPLHALNLNMLQVKNRSDLCLRLEVIKKSLAFPNIVIGVLFGIKVMILGMLVMNLLAFYLNSYWSGRLIQYPTLEQLKDISPSFFLAAFVSLAVFAIGRFLHVPNHLKLVAQLGVGTGLTVGIAQGFQMQDFLYLKEMVMEKLASIKGAA